MTLDGLTKILRLFEGTSLGNARAKEHLGAVEPIKVCLSEEHMI